LTRAADSAENLLDVHQGEIADAGKGPDHPFGGDCSDLLALDVAGDWQDSVEFNVASSSSPEAMSWDHPQQLFPGVAVDDRAAWPASPFPVPVANTGYPRFDKLQPGGFGEVSDFRLWGATADEVAERLQSLATDSVPIVR
jgi:hypothetical protein